jgi:hypothetical protein
VTVGNNAKLKQKMKKWTKKDALKEISNLISQIDSVAQSGRGSETHIRWWTNSMRIIEEIFGVNSAYYQTLASYSWSETGTRIYRGWDLNAEIDAYNQIAFVEQLRQARGLLLAAKDHLSSSDINDVYQGKNTAPESSMIIKILSLAENKLRKVIREKPNKEKLVQEAFENLLISTDIPYERENPSIEYSSKKYIPDFSFSQLDLIVEIKLCTETTTEKSLIAQINDDILAYQTKFGNIIFVIYDLGQIRDINKFSHSFENNDKVIIKIIKH